MRFIVVTVVATNNDLGWSWREADGHAALLSRWSV